MTKNILMIKTFVKSIYRTALEAQTWIPVMTISDAGQMSRDVREWSYGTVGEDICRVGWFIGGKKFTIIWNMWGGGASASSESLLLSPGSARNLRFTTKTRILRCLCSRWVLSLPMYVVCFNTSELCHFFYQLPMLFIGFHFLLDFWKTFLDDL